MWLSNLFSKTKDNVREDSINKNMVKKESINISSKHEEEPEFNDLKNRVEKVKMMHAKLQALQNKQDLNLNNNNTNTLRDKDKQCAFTNKNEKNVEINNCKIEDILRIIPVIENNLQSLTEKVFCLSDLFNAKQINAKIITENIISNYSHINTASNSVIKLNDVVNKTIQTKKNTSISLTSKKNKKMRKNKRSVIIKKKYSYQSVKIRTNSTEIINTDDKKVQVTNEENIPGYDIKSIEQLTNLDGRLEFFFTKILSAFTQYKIELLKEKSEIMFNMSRLEDKINTNYTKINKLMSNIEQLCKINDRVNQVISKKQSNLEIKKKHKLQKSIDSIKICIDDLIKPNPIEIVQTHQSITTDTNTNINSTCNSNRCVCQLIDNTNTASTQIINSYYAKNKIKYGDVILCEFLKAKLTLESIKRDEHQEIAQVNQFSNQVDANKNSHLSLFSKQSNLFSNICDVNQINNQKSSKLSVCSKKSSHLKKNYKRQEKPKINLLSESPKKSVHQFFKFGVENHTTNQKNTKKPDFEKNKICDFLSSQPIPEWIRLDENLVKSDNLCCKYTAKLSPSNCTLNVNKSYNIERIINDSHNKNDKVYEITHKPVVQK